MPAITATGQTTSNNYSSGTSTTGNELLSFTLDAGASLITNVTITVTDQDGNTVPGATFSEPVLGSSIVNINQTSYGIAYPPPIYPITGRQEIKFQVELDNDTANPVSIYWDQLFQEPILNIRGIGPTGIVYLYTPASGPIKTSNNELLTFELSTDSYPVDPISIVTLTVTDQDGDPFPAVITQTTFGPEFFNFEQTDPDPLPDSGLQNIVFDVQLSSGLVISGQFIQTFEDETISVLTTAGTASFVPASNNGTSSISLDTFNGAGVGTTTVDLSTAGIAIVDLSTTAGIASTISSSHTNYIDVTDLYWVWPGGYA